MLTTSIVRKRNPGELAALLSMVDVNKKLFGWKEKAVLTGMSIQGSNGKWKPMVLAAAPKILLRPDNRVEPSRLRALSFMFEWPGHVAAVDSTQTKNLLNGGAATTICFGKTALSHDVFRMSRYGWCRVKTVWPSADWIGMGNRRRKALSSYPLARNRRTIGSCRKEV